MIKQITSLLSLLFATSIFAPTSNNLPEELQENSDQMIQKLLQQRPCCQLIDKNAIIDFLNTREVGASRYSQASFDKFIETCSFARQVENEEENQSTKLFLYKLTEETYKKKCGKLKISSLAKKILENQLIPTINYFFENQGRDEIQPKIYIPPNAKAAETSLQTVNLLNDLFGISYHDLPVQKLEQILQESLSLVTSEKTKRFFCKKLLKVVQTYQTFLLDAPKTLNFKP